MGSPSESHCLDTSKSSTHQEFRPMAPPSPLSKTAKRSNKFVFKSPHPQSQLNESNHSKELEFDLELSSSMPFLAETPQLASSKDVAIKNSMHAYQWTLKDFDIGGYLGDGAHGTVFLARERRTGFICVLKCITKSHLIRANQEALLKKEVELQAHLKHPHIAWITRTHSLLSVLCNSVYTWFDTPSCVFLVMEYCYNGDLFHYLENHGPFDEKTVSRMLFEITWAIRTCHDKRIAHLDVKPENVLLNHKGECKLADFGLSAHIGSKQKRQGLHIHRGTLDYWSPEQCAHAMGSSTLFGEFNQKTDIWTLGILSFELMFSHPPFGSTEGNEFSDQNTTKRAVMTRIQTYHWSRVGIEKRFLNISKMSSVYKDFLDMCLDKNPDNRPTAEEVLMHEFIAKYNQDRLCHPSFMNQPRGGQLADSSSASPINHLGFNDQRGAFLTPRPLENLGYLAK
ncbi:PEK kinase [Cardiosporidium cionae]|uniref:PEK kinase n=1 Tax=Cardiosporidium cionae TaxID=476202 RepID=A0ABQ7J5C7_9APIC|nr:PEK kinase [Cardiosporidium cionae]|eukprot:KAF8819211.1 PEK kinase [Cardiosporidium cionae]